MGPVERAVRRIGFASLKTIVGRAPFEVAEFSADALVLLLGQGWKTPVSWSCLEGIPQFVGESCVKINGGDLSRPASNTLDGYLKAAGVQRRAGTYVAAVLVEANVVEAVHDGSLHIRLAKQ